MKKEIIVTDKVHDLLISGLRAEGFNVTYQPKMPYREVCTQVSKYNGIIINSKVICDQNFLKKSTHLDFIGRLGSGLDIIDLDEAKKQNIEVISSPEGNANAVGEHSLGMLLTLLNNIARSDRQVQDHQWIREPNRGRELRGKVVGIIGFGHTGPAFAKILAGFGVTIIVHDKYRTDYHGYVVTPLKLDEILSQSDIVSINLPLTKATRGMVDLEFIRRMKKGAILINTSRGGIAKSGDLVKGLNEGHLGGLCLDVLENEKPATWNDSEKEVYSKMISHPQTIITPHIAGWTQQSLRQIASILLEKICKFYKV